MKNYNVSLLLSEARQRWPKKVALFHRLKEGGFESQTFEQMERQVEIYAQALYRSGVKPQDKVLVLIPNSPELLQYVFALFRVGAIPILMDPGLGIKTLLASIRQVQPDILLAVPKVHLLCFPLTPWLPKFSLRLSTEGDLWGCTNLQKMSLDQPFEPHPVEADEVAALLFTSGATGPAKGVCYHASIFFEQVRLLQELYQYESQEVELAGFPLFGLFTLALGVSTVVAPFNASRPASCDPKVLLEAIRECEVTSLQGSPAIWKKLASYLKENQVELHQVRRLLTFGAPISFQFTQDWSDLLGSAQSLHTPYGATECLPLSTIDGQQLLSTKKEQLQGYGNCVGQPVENTLVQIIKTTDQAIETLQKEDLLPPGEIGEIIVHSSTMTRQYYQLNEANRKSKLFYQDKLYHRMGDLGYFDREGRLWLVGRKSHRLELSTGKTYYPLPFEAIANQHPEVKGSAYVEVRGKPYLVIAREESSQTPQEALKQQLLQIAGKVSPFEHPLEKVFSIRSLPVDPRHNAKIDRLQLKKWVKKRL